ncbi:MAG: transglycosylase SLT domain-containing protein [Prevotellaceae bacterium]|nr:transglycosylase SLT domain-containing protein [Prevotellaceae bacterium]
MPARAQEPVEPTQGMTYKVDSLLADWYARKYLSVGTGCATEAVDAAADDSVYMERLARIPSVIEMPYNEVVRQYIDAFTGRLSKLVSYMLGAYNFYMPLIEEALDAEGLPLELRYLPAIESGLNPAAVSRSGASGLWQFMLQTGRLYGLENNSLVDERRDPVKSTWAAVRYLKELYAIYGDWNLVIAAYNCGAGTVNKAIHRAGGKTDYWEIYNYLPKETRGYVPSFIAVNYVMTYYCKHGICPMTADLPEATDTVQVGRDLHFEQIAAVCNVPLEQLKSLNPQYKRDIIPGQSKPRTLRLPGEAVGRFIDLQDSVYLYRRNELFRNRRTASVPAGTRARTVVAKPGSGNMVYHRIASGETLSTIARQYGVTVRQLQEWNGLSGTNITAGKSLKVYGQ